MAFTDKTESANETQDHSQPLDDGGFFSLNDVITAGRHQLTRSEQLLAADTRRNARNLLASAKLLVLVVIVSVAMGVAAWAFLASLNIATDYREHHAWVYALLPVVGVATAWVYKNHGLAAKRGNNLVIDSALGTRLIHMRMAVLTFVCSTLTHLTGGSAGREGAAVQIGGTIASNISSLAHLKKHDHHDLMLAGISSAFGAVFGSPLAGAFFGMEMCFIGKIDYTAGIYCLVASFTGYFTSLALGTEYEANVIASVPAMTPKTVVIVVISAIIFGLTARLFAWSVRTVKSLYGRFITNYLVRALIGALVVWPPMPSSTPGTTPAFPRGFPAPDLPATPPWRTQPSSWSSQRLPWAWASKAARSRPCLASVRRSAAGSVASSESTPVFWRLSACSACSVPASTCPSPLA